MFPIQITKRFSAIFSYNSFPRSLQPLPPRSNSGLIIGRKTCVTLPGIYLYVCVLTRRAVGRLWGGRHDCKTRRNRCVLSVTPHPLRVFYYGVFLPQTNSQPSHIHICTCTYIYNRRCTLSRDPPPPRFTIKTITIFFHQHNRYAPIHI